MCEGLASETRSYLAIIVCTSLLKKALAETGLELLLYNKFLVDYCTILHAQRRPAYHSVDS